MSLKDIFLGFIGRIAPALLSINRSNATPIKGRPVLATDTPVRPLMRHERGRIEPLVRIERKVGRNEPCTCGSGKKFKACCL